MALRKFILIGWIFGGLLFYLIPSALQAKTDTKTDTETKENLAPPIIYESAAVDNLSTEEDESKSWIRESLDANGQPVKDYEYRDQWTKQGEGIQKQAALPFGAAGKKFGKKAVKSAKIHSMNDPESEVENSSEVSEEQKKESQEAKQNKIAAEKPRVLVS